MCKQWQSLHLDYLLLFSLEKVNSIVLMMSSLRDQWEHSEVVSEGEIQIVTA